MQNEHTQVRVYEAAQAVTTEAGQPLPGLRLAYHTWGQLSETRDNVVWVLHALTGSSDCMAWWPGLFGPGAAYDPSTHFIVCVNTIGGCYGSTGPLSTNQHTGQPYYHDFPLITHRDVVQAFQLLAAHLGIARIDTLIGGSLGGQQALEWAIMQPSYIRHLVLIATNAQHSPWGIAFNEAQRMAIAADATWPERTPEAGLAGMQAARAIGMLSYRNYACYDSLQPRQDSDGLSDYAAASYQRYQGHKLAGRFNAFSYWVLSQAMDAHDVGRGRVGLVQALGLVQARTLVIGISSDILFPIEEQKFLAAHIPQASLQVVDSLYGHDGFLTETLSIQQCLQQLQQPLPARAQ